MVTKLFNILSPDVAYFGQKDYQQGVVIKRMVADFNMAVEIRVLPIAREEDGLAFSSRNARLNPEERREATCLHKALQRARAMVTEGRTDAVELKSAMQEEIEKASSASVDYIALVDPETLEDLHEVRGRAVAALAVWIGETRLIDNEILTTVTGR